MDGPTPQAQPGYGNRLDGTPKGMGYFGELKRPDGKVSTELSVGVNLDGQEHEIPLLVPTLSREEIDHLLKDGEPTPEIMNKAVEFARQRMQQGRSPFAGEGEPIPLPQPMAEQNAAQERFNAIRGGE